MLFRTFSRFFFPKSIYLSEIEILLDGERKL